MSFSLKLIKKSIISWFSKKQRQEYISYNSVYFFLFPGKYISSYIHIYYTYTALIHKEEIVINMSNRWVNSASDYVISDLWNDERFC